MTSVEEDAVSSEDNASQDDGSMDQQSPQLDVADAVSQDVQHDADQPTQQTAESTTSSTDSRDLSSPDLDKHVATSPPDPSAKEGDGGQSADCWRPVVGASPPPLPSPPSMTAAVDEDDNNNASADLVITDVAKYVSTQIMILRLTRICVSAIQRTTGVRIRPRTRIRIYFQYPQISTHE